MLFTIVALLVCAQEPKGAPGQDGVPPKIKRYLEAEARVAAQRAQAETALLEARFLLARFEAGAIKKGAKKTTIPALSEKKPVTFPSKSEQLRAIDRAQVEVKEARAALKRITETPVVGQLHPTLKLGDLGVLPATVVTRIRSHDAMLVNLFFPDPRATTERSTPIKIVVLVRGVSTKGIVDGAQLRELDSTPMEVTDTAAIDGRTVFVLEPLDLALVEKWRKLLQKAVPK